MIFTPGTSGITIGKSVELKEFKKEISAPASALKHLPPNSKETGFKGSNYGYNFNENKDKFH